MIGWPEGRIILSQCAIYLACCPKSNAAYMAIENALDTVRRTGDLPVPLHLRNAPTKLMKDIGYGKGYGYSHDGPGHFIEQEFLPDAIGGKAFYTPGDSRREQEYQALIRRLWGEKYLNQG